MTLPTVGITSVDDFSPIYEGDTLVPFKPQFWQWDDTSNAYVALDISGYTIGMKMSNGTTTKVCNGTWTKAGTGQASYQWEAEDVDTAGTWQLFITLTDGNGRVGHIDTKTLEIKGAP